MNSSRLLTAPPSAVSHCLHPLECCAIRLSRTSFSPCRRHRFRVSLSSISAPLPNDSDAQGPPHSVFGDKRELSGFQALVESFPKQVRVAASLVIAAGAVAAGYSLGVKFGGNRILAIGSAAAAGIAASAALYSLNSSAPEVAAAALHNLVAEVDDPKDLKKDDVDNIAKKYGVSKNDGAFVSELKDIYCRFLSSVLPSGSKDLQGNEAETIVNFKNALGIDDLDAAAMHMEIGRRIFRERLETGDREGDVEQHRAFQKLIYVSDLVFGKASSFLLPWKRVFKVTDSQIELAMRDNAQRLYALSLKSLGRDVNAEQLIALKQAQLKYKVSDEAAIDLFRQRMGVLIKTRVSSALEMLKSSAKSGDGMKNVVLELEQMLQLNNKLVMLAKHPGAAAFPPGVGPVSLADADDEVKMDDLKILYSVYVTDALSGGRLEESKQHGFVQLRRILGLKKEDAEAISLDITSKVYRRRLAQSFSGGELDAAPSKAAYLQALCSDLRFDSHNAAKVHQEIYAQKLQKCVVDGELNEEDASALNRIRVLLCVPQRTVDAIHSETCGGLFEKAVNDAIASGVEGFDEHRRKSVIKSLRGLRLTEELAMAIATKTTLKTLVMYTKRASAAGKRSMTAEEVKRMLTFYSLVVTPLMSDIKAEFSDSLEEPKVEETETETETVSPSVLEISSPEDEWRSLETLKKVKIAEELTPVSSNLITLEDEVPLEDRMELYKKYLMHCISGKVVTLPFGAQLPIKSDSSEYVFLNQLGNLLGLTSGEIVEVHKTLAERAFQKKAQSLLSDGQITKAKIEQLNEIQKNVGLPDDFAQSVIKSITSTKMATVLQNALDRGSLNIKQIRELKDASVDLDSLVSERLREELFKKTIDEIFSSGTGEFDSVEVYENITSDLKINPDKAKAVVSDVARRRLSNSLIQAVALLRQRDHAGVVMTLNDLLACDKAMPSEPLSWDRSAELIDLFSHYLRSDPTAENLSRLQYLLGLSDSVVAGVRQSAKVARENVMLLGAEEENFVF